MDAQTELRAVLTRIGDELAGIRRCLEGTSVAQSPVAIETGCPPHPIDRRIEFGVTNGREDWQCGVCGYRPTTEGDVHG